MEEMELIKVNRPALDQVELDLKTKDGLERQSGVGLACRRCCRCSCACWSSALLSMVPFVGVLKSYQLRDLPYDMLAGLSVGIVHIPQSIGFALLASLPPVYGLYTSFWPVLFYFFFGTSRHMSLGTMAVISILTGNVVERELALRLGSATSGAEYHGANVSYGADSINTTQINASLMMSESGVDEGVFKASVAGTLALMIGLIQLGMSLLRMGFITTFMPMSFVSGFTTATAFHIASSQFKHVFGLEVERNAGMFGLPLDWANIATNLPKTSIPTLIISLICIIILILFKEVINEKFKDKIKVPIPAELIVVGLATLISYLVSFESKWDVVIVGDIPTGIPTPAVPPLEYAPRMVVDAFVGAILSFVITYSLANVFTRRHNYVVDGNQELLAYGFMHTASSFFHCFAGAAAPPRCFVFESSGGRTSVAHLFSCVLILIVLLAIGPAFAYLPNAVLGSVIIVALFPLFKQFRDLKTFWRTSKVDFFIWIVTCSTSVLLDIGVGLAIGVSFSIFTVALQPSFTRGYLLTPTLHADVFVPADSSRKEQKPGAYRIFRFDNTLHFASVQRFKSQLYSLVFDPRISVASKTSEENGKGGDIKTNLSNGKEENGQTSLRVIILDCSSFTDIDVTGASTLSSVHAEYAAVGVKVVLASCGNTAQRHLAAAGLAAPDGPLRLYPTIQDAVKETSEREYELDTLSNEEDPTVPLV